MADVTPAVPASSDKSTAAPADASKTPAVPENKTPPVPEKMYKVKINGKEEEWPESKVLERAQMSEAAEQKFKRAAGMEKAFSNFVSMAKTPDGALKLLQNPAIGADLKGVVLQAVKSNPDLLGAVKQLLIRQEVIPTLPEEQRIQFESQAELEDLRAFKKAQEAAEQARIKREQDAAKQSVLQKQLAVVGQQIAEALKGSGLPDSPQIGARVARVMLLSRKNGTNLSPSQAVEQVKNDLKSEYHAQFTGVDDDEKLLSLLPEGMAERLNKALINKLKSSQKSQVKDDKNQPKKRDKSWVRHLGRDIL